MTIVFIALYILSGAVSSAILYYTTKKELHVDFKIDIKEEIKDDFSFKCAFILHWIFSLITGWYGLIITIITLLCHSKREYITFYYRIPKIVQPATRSDQG